MGGWVGLDCRDGRVPVEWAREVRQQVPLRVDHEVPPQGAGWASGIAAGAGTDPADVSDAGGADREGAVSVDHVHLLVVPHPQLSPAKLVQ